MHVYPLIKHRDSDRSLRATLPGFVLFSSTVVDSQYVLLAGEGVSQAAEEDSSGIGLHRLSLR